MRAVVGVLALAGCVQPNAMLELSIELPRAEAGRASALVQVRRWEPGIFEAEWHSDEDIEPVLLGPEHFIDQVSVEADQTEIDVALRVSFCSDPRCGDDSASRDQVWFRIERPFFLGERSEWGVIAVPSREPPIEQIVARCEIRACVTGDRAPNYCDDIGLHACDRE